MKREYKIQSKSQKAAFSTFGVLCIIVPLIPALNSEKFYLTNYAQASGVMSLIFLLPVGLVLWGYSVRLTEKKIEQLFSTLE